MNLITASATEIAAMVLKKELSAEEVRSAFHARFRSREEEVLAWVDRRFATKTEMARLTPGPLAGIPVGIKDVIDTVDFPTQMGSSIFSGHQPAQDAQVVSRLKSAGAIIAGKTVSTEFALHGVGETRNPYDTTRTPGGSSSGSAAAVADGMVPVALGTQTTASVVRPASFCGVFGMKPTFGFTSRQGLFIHSPSMDTVGFLARHAVDLSLLLEVTGFPGFRTSAELERKTPLRLKFLRTNLWEEMEPEVRSTIESAILNLPSDEFQITEGAFPESLLRSYEAHPVLHNAETANALSVLFDLHKPQFSDALSEFISQGRKITQKDYWEAWTTLRSSTEQVGMLIGETVDALITPSVFGEAPVGMTTGDPRFGRVWSGAGVPVVSVPGLKGPNELPLGLQIVGRAGSDYSLVDIAGKLASAFGYEPRHLPA